jgi:ribosomal protein L37AE/L43A
MERCERCGRFGARPTWVVGAPLPRTPQENWIWQQAIIASCDWGDYGAIVKVSDGPVEGYESFQVYLCSSCSERGTLVIRGRRSKCDSCGKFLYGLGNNFGHTCESCALAEEERER